MSTTDDRQTIAVTIELPKPTTKGEHGAVTYALESLDKLVDNEDQRGFYGLDDGNPLPEALKAVRRAIEGAVSGHGPEASAHADGLWDVFERARLDGGPLEQVLDGYEDALRGSRSPAEVKESRRAWEAEYAGIVAWLDRAEELIDWDGGQR